MGALSLEFEDPVVNDKILARLDTKRRIGRDFPSALHYAPACGQQGKLIESEDYFHVTRKNSMDEIRTLEIPPKGIVLLTESGYLLLVKSFTDDLVWQVQRRLVKTISTTQKLLSPLRSSKPFPKSSTSGPKSLNSSIETYPYLCRYLQYE